MTYEETAQVLATIALTYPNFKPPSMEQATTVWANILSEYTFSDIQVGLKAYITSDVTGFAPTPGQIIAKTQIVKDPKSLNAVEAWGFVSKAIRNSGYNSVTEFEKLPKLAQKAVGEPLQLKTWAMDDNYNESVIMSQFVKAYNSELERQQSITALPTSMRQSIESREPERKQLTTANEHSLIEMAEKKSVPMPERARKALDELYSKL